MAMTAAAWIVAGNKFKLNVHFGRRYCGKLKTWHWYGGKTRSSDCSLRRKVIVSNDRHDMYGGKNEKL